MLLEVGTGDLRGVAIASEVIPAHLFDAFANHSTV